MTTKQRWFRDYGLTANEMVDLCDTAMEATRRAGEASDRADQVGGVQEHHDAMEAHQLAEAAHDEAHDRSVGTAGTVHAQFRADHRMMADQHLATAQAINDSRAEEMERNRPSDYPQSAGGAVQNFNDRRRPMTRRRPGDVTMNYLSSADAQAQLRYWRSQGIDSRTYEQIARRVRAQQEGIRQPVHNCSCQNPDEDALISPTQADMLGIPSPTTNSSMAPGELRYQGVCDNPDDALISPTLNYDRITRNVVGSAASRTGDPRSWVGGGSKGQWTQAARDAVDVPGFNIGDAMDRNYADVSRYPRDGVKPSPVLTSGRPRVTPQAPPATSPYEGADSGSYAPRGVKGYQGSNDSAGDDYEDDSAPAGLGQYGQGPRGQRSDRGQPSGGYMPEDQYDAPMKFEDRGDEQRGTVIRGGESVYMADWLQGRATLPNDYNGQSYRRSPTQAEDDYRRQFGSQPRPKGMTGNVENVDRFRQEDMLIPETIDYKALSAANASR